MTSYLSKPRVSILCTTYNHKKYIRQCLEGFVSQITSFDIEVLVYDDFSTDGTTEILKEYKKKYPEIFKLFLQKTNQYSKGKRNAMARHLLPKASGEYVALCEGDDFWTDPEKLQKQVDFLDAHKDYSLCFHPVRVFFEGGEGPESIYPHLSDRYDFSLAGLLKKNFIQTNSVMYRRQQYKNIAIGVMPGDWYLHLYHAQFGKIGFINKIMSSYRIHPGGMWWGVRQNRDELIIKHGASFFKMYIELLKIYNNNPIYKRIINRHIEILIDELIRTRDSQEEPLLAQLMQKFPEQFESYLIYQHNRLEEELSNNKTFKTSLLKKTGKKLARLVRYK